MSLHNVFRIFTQRDWYGVRTRLLVSVCVHVYVFGEVDRLKK